MQKAGMITLFCSLLWLAGMGTAAAGGHADIDNVFATAKRAGDGDRFNYWGEAPPRSSYVVSSRRPGEWDDRLLWAQNENESAEEDWEDEWGEDETVAEEIPDPLLPWNWMWFHFNDKFFLYVWEPLAEGYGYVVPEVARRGVRNFFTNLTTPVRLVNCLLQGKWDDAGNETARFLINTTAGILGFGDPAYEKYGPPKDEDFGQTLGYWGLNDGFFLTWPFLGPSSLRDTIGFVADGYLHPVSYIDGNPHKTTPTKIAIRAYDIFNRTSLQIGEYEKLRNMALDPYIAIRNIYFQNRQKKIAE
jgi:phospholipid-binding lipoprotein MlaA